jgi:hypothetical protein
MTFFMEFFRKKLGWCPNADPVRTSRYADAEHGYENAWKGRDPGAAPDPESAGARGIDHPEYQDNILLILIALGWLLPLVYQREYLSFFVILSAVAMYYDAQNIHAGRSFEKETLFGDIETWRPLTWGAATLVGGVIIMAIYLFHRKEIFIANN